MSDLKQKIVKLKDNIDRMSKVFDVLQPIPESDIHECYWKLIRSYIDEIDPSPRDPSGYKWLDWFIFENNWGEGELEIKLSGGEWEKVKTIEDIVRIIESDKPLKFELVENGIVEVNDYVFTYGDSEGEYYSEWEKQGWDGLSFIGKDIKEDDLIVKRLVK